MILKSSLKYGIWRVFNTVSWKSHILQGWDESEPIILCIDNAFATMPKGYTSSITSVHFMNYHFVWCPKYRRKVIVADVESKLREIIRDTAKENNWEIIALETMPDHVHLFIKTNPTIAPNNVIARIKGRSSRILRNHLSVSLSSCLSLQPFSLPYSILQILSSSLRAVSVPS